jgi:hypothetical protein
MMFISTGMVEVALELVKESLDCERVSAKVFHIDAA